MQVQEINSKKPLKLGLLSDTHLCPSGRYEDMDVLRAAGEFFFEQRVDHVFHLGDLGEFRGANKYKGGRLMGGNGSDEGHDLQQDIQIWREGLHVLRKPYALATQKHKAARHQERIHPCQYHILFGNHEDMPYRIGREFKVFRSLMSSVDYDMYRMAKEEGYIAYPYLQPVAVNGFLLQHCFEGRDPHQTLSITTIQSRNSMSSAYGHTHGRDIRIWKNGMRKMQAIINTGCTKHPDRVRRFEESGVWIIDRLMDGEFNFSWHPTQEILDTYYMKNGRLAA